MATINYVTLKLPKVLWEETEIIQDTPNFEVRKYKFKKGIIYRVPHGLKENDVCHAFLEHEINLSNTLKSGTLTMKVQVTFVPCHLGVFSGFKELKGSYDTVWWDEDSCGEEYFKPDYDNDENIKNIVPLPPNLKTNLNKFLNKWISCLISAKEISDIKIEEKLKIDPYWERIYGKYIGEYRIPDSYGKFSIMDFYIKLHV